MKILITLPILFALAFVPYAIGQFIGVFWASSTFDGILASFVMSPFAGLNFTCWWAWYRIVTFQQYHPILPPP